jgi:hypothetical protein
MGAGAREHTEMQMEILAQESCCPRWLEKLERHGVMHNATELRVCRCGRRYFVQFACVPVGGTWCCNVVDAAPAPESSPSA